MTSSAATFSVLSDTRFHQSTARAMVAPSIATVAADESPWRPGDSEERFAVDFLTTLPLDRLLEAVGRVDAATLRRAHRAIVLWLRRPLPGSRPR